jgi:small subunit ribosomal protein S17
LAEAKKRKIKLGRVVSNKMDKTVVVAVESYRPHPIYKKAVRRIKKFKAHDEQNTCHIGDMVKIEETRPLSKEKRWRVVEILSKG